MIKKLFKLAGLAALLTSACAPLSLKAMDCDYNYTKNNLETFTKAIVGKDPTTIDSEFQDLDQKSSLFTSNSSFKNAALAELKNYIMKIAPEESWGCYTIEAFTQSLKKYTDDLETIKDILLVRTLFYPTGQDLVQMTSRKDCTKDSLLKKFSEWKEWYLKDNNNNYRYIENDIDISNIVTTFNILGILQGEQDSFFNNLFLDQFKRTIENGEPSNINCSYEHLNAVLKNNSAFKDAAYEQIVSWINWAITQNTLSDNISKEALESCLNQYGADVKIFNDRLGKIASIPRLQQKNIVEPNANTENLPNQNPEPEKEINDSKINNQPKNLNKFALNWLTNNSYFKPTVITLSVITMGIVSLWAFKKFCPQYSAKISSLFKLPRLWSRTPKVNPLQHNFNYAI